MLRITGTLTTTSPLMIASPNAGDLRVDLSGRRTKSGFPATGVVRLGLPASGEAPAMQVPIVSPNTLRGALRRAGTDLIEDALKSRNETVTLGTYHALRCGTPYGHPDKASPSIADIQKAQETPPLAVFGGGPRMIESALRCDTGFPVLQSLIERGIISDRLLAQAMPADSRLTMYLFLRRADDAATFVDHTMAQHIVRSYTESIDAWQTLIGRSHEASSASDEVESSEDEGPMRGLAALNAFEIVLPGTAFTFSADLATEHPASIGFFLLALARFANKQRLGGYGRLGFGRFRLEVTGAHDDDHLELLSKESERYVPDASDEQVAAWLDAARSWLANVSAADLNSLMTPSETSLQAVKKKLKGRAEAEAAFDRVYGA